MISIIRGMTIQAVQNTISLVSILIMLCIAKTSDLLLYDLLPCKDIIIKQYGKYIKYKPSDNGMRHIVGFASKTVYNGTDYHDTDNIKKEDTDATDETYHNSFSNIIHLIEGEKRYKCHHFDDAGTFIVNVEGDGRKHFPFWYKYHIQFIIGFAYSRNLSDNSDR
jgi:hypothetical protein